MTTAACVLISRDKGATWKASGDIEDARTWLVNPTIEEGSKGQLIMLFRSAAGEASSQRATAWAAQAGDALIRRLSYCLACPADGSRAEPPSRQGVHCDVG